jgi:hypothetical protein
MTDLYIGDHYELGPVVITEHQEATWYLRRRHWQIVNDNYDGEPLPLIDDSDFGSILRIPVAPDDETAAILQHPVVAL